MLTAIKITAEDSLWFHGRVSICLEYDGLTEVSQTNPGFVATRALCFVQRSAYMLLVAIPSCVAFWYQTRENVVTFKYLCQMVDVVWHRLHGRTSGFQMSRKHSKIERKHRIRTNQPTSYPSQHDSPLNSLLPRSMRRIEFI